MGDEQAADDSGERLAFPRRQPGEQGRNVRLEPRRGLGDEEPAVVGEADQHRPPVRRRGNAGDQPAALRAVDQAGDARLVDSQEPGQLVHRRLAIPEDAQQPRLDDREVVLGGPALEQALDHEGELSQSIDGAQLLTRAWRAWRAWRATRLGRHGRSLLYLVRVTN